MNRRSAPWPGRILLTFSLIAGVAFSAVTSWSQSFDFERLENKVRDFTVTVNMKIEVSFGVHTAEQEERYLGTVVSQDGLVMFSGVDLASDNALSSYSGFSVKTNPTSIEISTLEGDTYDGEYVGTDHYTRIGFVRIVGARDKKFNAVKFQTDRPFEVGDWLALYMLLPEFMSPSLAADIGMVSLLVESPESFPLTVGFNSLQLISVLFDERLDPVGVLGALVDPSLATRDGGGFAESYRQFGIPLLGVVTGERLEKLINDPPTRGQEDRSWLGIRHQALTPDMAAFWNLDLPGGIIVNEIIRNSPAENAGLAVGDIIFEVNGEMLNVDREEKLPVFQRLIAEMPPGESVELSILRPAGQAVDTIKAITTLEKAPMAATDAPEYEDEALEFKVRDLVFGDCIVYNQDPDSFTGVFVSELKKGGLAYVGGLHFGDVVQRINNTPVASVEEVRTIMLEVERNRPREVIFFIWRSNKTMFINIKTDWQQ